MIEDTSGGRRRFRHWRHVWICGARGPSTDSGEGWNEGGEIEVLKREILERLQPLDPERVIVFGRYTWGHPTEDSDIDLSIVTKDDFLPQSDEARRERVRRVSRALWNLRLRTPIPRSSKPARSWRRRTSIRS